jgi:site-specific recombinase XerD
MKATDFATHLAAFLTHYLPAQRNIRPNTIRAYRDTIVLLLRFCRDVKSLKPERLTLAQIDAPLVREFLEHLGRERNWSERTRNVRLSALHAFFRYVQIEDPGLILHCQKILAIPMQRCSPANVEYLNPDDLAAILNQPDLTTIGGRRDAVLLSLLYDTGARVTELINLTVRDVRLECPPQISITGKGERKRAVPLMQATVKLLSDYLLERGLAEARDGSKPLFQNRFGRRLSRSGVRYILEKYANRARATRGALASNVSPHTLRHTKAMHLLQSGNPLVVIRDFLGHVDIKTTEIYARADMEMKRAALNRAVDKSPTAKLPPWQKDAELLEWLSSL